MGISEAIAARYAEAGARLLLLHIADKQLETVAETLCAAYDVDVATYHVDLAHREEITRFWEQLDITPDILVNNAGAYEGRVFQDTTETYRDNMIQVNFGAVVQMCQEFIRRRKRRGTIINVSSIEAKAAFKVDMAMYAASKAAVLTLTRSLASEYSRHGFKINSIVPGGVRMRGIEQVARHELSHLHLGIIATAVKFAQRLPLGHYADPDDVARVALMLASPMSDYMSGSEVVVDGGFLVA